MTRRFSQTDLDGRRFTTSNLRNPGLRPNLHYEYKGFKPHPDGWAVSRERMEQYDLDNRLVFPIMWNLVKLQVDPAGSQPPRRPPESVQELSPFITRIHRGWGDCEMYSMKRRTLPSGRVMVVAATCFVLGVATFAYGDGGTDTSAVRRIKGRTIFSGESPKAKLSIPRGFRFIGTQQVSLHGNAEAEQYVFARSGRDNVVERFYLIQFEHFLPTNHLTYDYASMRTTQIDKFQFNYDVKSFPDFGALLMEDQGSDGAAMEQLLAKQHLLLPHNTAMVRMFHLPSADHRTELMIIYGEALPQNTAVPVRKGGVQLDTESPDLAQMFLEHARQGLVLQTR